MSEGGPAVLGRWPLFWPAVGAVFGLLSAEWMTWWPLAVAVAGTVFLGIHFGKPPLVLAGLVGLALAVLHAGRMRERDELGHEMARRDRIELEGVVVQSDATGLVRRVFAVAGGGRVALVDLPEEVKTGERLRVSGQPVGHRLPRNPVGLDVDEILRRRGFAGTVVVLEVQRLGWSRGFSRVRGWAENLRGELGQAVTRGIRDRHSAEVVRAVVLGEKAGGSEAFEDFRRTGTMHIFAVSGLHVGLVAFLVMGFAKLIRMPPREMILLTLVAMVVYVLVTGLKPPAARAALMGGFILVRFFLKRRSAVLNNLCAAMLVVLAMDSFQLWQVGFQLSFLVVAVILGLEPLLWGRVEPLLREDPYLPKQLWSRFQRWGWAVKEKVGRSLTVSCAAWLGSSPLNFVYFGWFTPVTAFASVLMVGVAFVLLLLALVSAGLGVVWVDGSRALNGINGFVAGRTRAAAFEMGTWPGASQRFKPEAPWEGGLVVFDLPFGGSAVHLDAGGGVLVDGGSRVDFERIILPPLEHFGMSCDSLFASHADASHISGLEVALLRMPVKQLLIPRGGGGGTINSLREEGLGAGVRLVESSDGQRLPVEEGIELIVYEGIDGVADENCLVMKIYWHGWRILVTGDAGIGTERRLLKEGVDLQSEVWICGRSTRSLQGTGAFVRAVNPKVVIANDPVFPAEERLPRGWQDWLESTGVTFFNQNEVGAVFLNPERDQLAVEGYLDKKTFVLRRPSSGSGSR